MEHYFFEKVRPIVEKALRGRQSRRLAADHVEPRLQGQQSRASGRGAGVVAKVPGLADHHGEDRRSQPSWGRWMCSRSWC